MRRVMTAIGMVCLAGGLAACANYADNDNTRYNDTTRPIGYYSTDRLNDQYRYGRYGTNRENYDNAYILNGQSGPITDFLGTDNNRTRIPGLTRFDTETPALPLGDDFGDSDRNYHGHLNSMNAKTHPSYYKHYDGRLAETVARRAATVKEVGDARALVYNDHVLVAITTNEKDTNRVERLVSKAIVPYTKGKHVRVVSNPSMYNRVRVIDNNIRYGRPSEEIERDLKTIFYNGQIIERPANHR
ncbi:YhcN/YlaJ family sporulation lipoprotein [Thermaerobacillus caldiproteolyticus]|uniref:YhcN/YlaJ family sporulation lipoprotein n=1 Tax=Thermaerobacillus caldiproteolyticus TaxID=247480 RepID=UPI00358DC8FC